MPRFHHLLQLPLGPSFLSDRETAELMEKVKASIVLWKNVVGSNHEIKACILLLERLDDIPAKRRKHIYDGCSKILMVE
jgi:hypothetical protein